MNDQNAKPAVAQDVIVVMRLKKRIQADRDCPHFDRAEKTSYPFGRVGSKNAHKLAKTNPTALKRIANLVDFLRNLQKGQLPATTKQRFLATTLGKIPLQYINCVVLRR